MNTQDEQVLEELIQKLHKGADLYRQAERRHDGGLANQLKSIVKVRESSLAELQPYMAGLHRHTEATANFAVSPDWAGNCNQWEYNSNQGQLSLEQFEQLEGELLSALEQAIKLPTSKALRNLLTDIQGRASACYYNVRQMRQTQQAVA